MNIKIGGNKVNPFSVGNPVADLGDAIVGTYGPGGSGQSAGEISVDDGGSTGGSGNSGSSDDGYGWEDFKRDFKTALKIAIDWGPIILPLLP